MLVNNSESRAPIFTSVNDTCEALNRGRDEVYELIRAGEIESFLDGRRRIIVYASVVAYAQRAAKSKATKFERARHPARGPSGTIIQSGIGAKPAAAQGDVVQQKRRSGAAKNSIPAHEAS